MALDIRRRAVDQALARLGPERQRLDEALEVALQGLSTIAQTQDMMQEVAEMARGLHEERRAVRRRVVCVV